MNHSLLPYQWDAIHSKYKYTLLLGGIGSGKSHAGSPWILKAAKDSPDSLGLITANTYSQLMSATLASVFRNFDAWNIPVSYNGQKKLLTVANKKQFLCLSADTYDNHRGIEVGEWWGDEAAYYKEEAFKVFSGRLRDKRGKLNVMFTTTAKGFNWLYDYFHENGEKRTDEYYYIKARSELNKHLPDGYLDSLKQQYDEKLIEQELNGEFVNLTMGKAYYAFDRNQNVMDFQKPTHGTAFVFNDWNVDPMSGVIAYQMGGAIYVWDEIFQRNSDTYRFIDEIKQKGYLGVTVIPDSTGQNRKTSGKSDFDIMRSAGFNVLYNLNPYVVDRVNNVNRLLRDKKIIIHPRCKKLINDLEKVSWKDNKLDQKTDPMLTHISDGLGYGAWKLMPIGHKSNARIKLY